MPNDFLNRNKSVNFVSDKNTSKTNFNQTAVKVVNEKQPFFYLPHLVSIDSSSQTTQVNTNDFRPSVQLNPSKNEGVFSPLIPSPSFVTHTANQHLNAHVVTRSPPTLPLEQNTKHRPQDYEESPIRTVIHGVYPRVAGRNKRFF